MQVTMKAVRVYGSAAYSATEAEIEQSLRQITLEDCHFDDVTVKARAAVYLGPPLPWIITAHVIRRTIGDFILNWYRGIPYPDNPDDAIGQAVLEFDTSEVWRDSWYVTLVVEQDFDVPPSAVNETQFVWLEDDPYERAQAFLQHATPCLDRLAILCSTVVSPSAFERVIVADHVYFAATGRTTFGLPEGSMSARLTVSRPLATLDVGVLERRLKASVTADKSVLDWLESVTPWWLAGLREKDPWKAFVQLFTGLELLLKQVASRYYNRVVYSQRVQSADQAAQEQSPILCALWCLDKEKKPKICPRKDLGRRGEFAVIALALFPDQAEHDYALFLDIKGLRNDLAHGDRMIARGGLPLDKLRTLLGRYLDATLEEHLT